MVVGQKQHQSAKYYCERASYCSRLINRVEILGGPLGFHSKDDLDK